MGRPNNDQEHLRRLRDLYAREHCLPPFEQVATVLGFRSRAAVHHLMLRLRRSGHVVKAAGGRMAPGPRFFRVDAGNEKASSPAELDDGLNPMKLAALVSRFFTRTVDAPLRELGVSMSRMPVLLALHRHPVLLQSDLARIAQVEQPSMAQLLSRMERDGLVERRSGEDRPDARSSPIRLTTTAEQLLPQARAVLDNACDRALTGFSSAECTQLVDLLARVLVNLSVRDAMS